jgi:hypothetical protein
MNQVCERVSEHINISCGLDARIVASKHTEGRGPA